VSQEREKVSTGSVFRRKTDRGLPAGGGPNEKGGKKRGETGPRNGAERKQTLERLQMPHYNETEVGGEKGGWGERGGSSNGQSREGGVDEIQHN